MGKLYEVSENFGVRILEFDTTGRDAITAPTFTAVLDKDLSVPPGSPSPGDRYIVASGGSGLWAGHDNEIADWNGSSWDFTVSATDDKVVVSDESLTYFFVGDGWQVLRGLIIYNSTTDQRENFDGAAWVGMSEVGHAHTASDVSDFDTEVSNNTDVDANTTHRGSTSNPHSATLEQARTAGASLSGDVDFNSNTGTNIKTPVASGDIASKSYVDSLIQGLDWQDSVLDKDLTAPPGGESVGDRYIVGGSATGDWSGQDDAIAEVVSITPTVWSFQAPNEGFAAWVEDENLLYVFNGAAWVKFGSTVDHGNLLGLADDDHTQYHNDTRGDIRYHTKSEFLGTSAGAGDSGKPIKLDGDGTVDVSMINDADIDHTNIGSIGSNAHSVIDTHLASTSNPHSVDKTDVSLGNVENLKVNLIATTDPGTGNDNTEGYAVGSTWTNVTLDKAFIALDVSTGAAVWIETTQSGSIQMPIEISIGGNADPQFSTSSTSYVVAAAFRFAGTTALGTPTAMKAIGFKDASPTSWDIQIFDLTNANIIATKTGNTGTASELVDMGTLSNLPTGAAIFEVQLKRAGGTGGSAVHVQAASIDF